MGGYRAKQPIKHSALPKASKEAANAPGILHSGSHLLVPRPEEAIKEILQLHGVDIQVFFRQIKITGVNFVSFSLVPTEVNRIRDYSNKDKTEVTSDNCIARKPVTATYRGPGKAEFLADNFPFPFAEGHPMHIKYKAQPLSDLAGLFPIQFSQVHQMIQAARP